MCYNYNVHVLTHILLYKYFKILSVLLDHSSKNLQPIIINRQTLILFYFTWTEKNRWFTFDSNQYRQYLDFFCVYWV